MKKRGIKGQIKLRSTIALILIVAIGVAVLYKIFVLQTGIHHNEAIAKAEKNIIKKKEIPATRGNIYASDGKSLLATSIPIYRVGFGPCQAKEELFHSHIDSLSMLLSSFFKDKSAEAYKRKLVEARKRKDPFEALGNRTVSHEERNYILTFPLFREGTYTGGGQFERLDDRYLPFKSMATRTIGKLDPSNPTKGQFGIEYSFNPYLKGVNGKGVFEVLPGGYNLPLESAVQIKSTPGYDVITTLDVNFQDIVESALREQVLAENANYGTAIVMEAGTGEIKAMANLSRRERNGKVMYVEDENHAVLGMTDPGSTFKLATMLAVLEESDLHPEDFLLNCNGNIRIGKANLACSHPHGKLTVKEVLEQSCNVGTYELIRRAFGAKGYDKYRSYIEKFRLDKAVDFQLKGEKVPLIKNSDSKTFSATTFPWTSIGYEMAISPLQMLTFYNAVANDGYWIQPLLVKEIKEVNRIVEVFTANRLNHRIAANKNIKAVQSMLQGVVLNGTAKKISEGECTVAGKTGTAQKRVNGSYTEGNYYASFIGYFPADNPKYTCLVVIDQPRGKNKYGGDACAPVFRKIADRIFAYDISIHPTYKLVNAPHKLLKKTQPAPVKDLVAIAKKFDLEVEATKDIETGILLVEKEKAIIHAIEVEKGGVPNVDGMSLRDALFVLENKGYKVKYSGMGKVQEVQTNGQKEVLLLLN